LAERDSKNPRVRTPATRLASISAPARSRAVAGAIAIAAAALTGCGDSPEKEVRSTLKKLIAAVRERDASTVCEIVLSRSLSAPGREREVARAKDEALCKRNFGHSGEFQNASGFDVTVGRVTVNGRTARVVARLNPPSAGLTVWHLAQIDGRWRLLLGD
jgi:hypothetical protein